MKVTIKRITGRDIEEVSARLWGKHPGAKALFIKYLYCGWYEYSIL